ncbi:MAG: class I SAM-dependent methyltransferase [Termitinemataceae bacterium]|nr:MAG: class I SAM-dependent methyltransferase [Termitinemataceae bacterium]
MIKTWSTEYKNEERILRPCDLCGGVYFKKHFFCEGWEYIKCTKCGLVQVNPQPIEPQVHQRYDKSYLDYELANEKAFLDLALKSLDDAGIDDIKKIVTDDPALGASVLDIGCATGALLEHLRDASWEVKGIEISKPEAEYACNTRGLDVSYLPLQEKKFPSESFSVVIASHLIEHLNSPAAFVKEVLRILKPGGFFIVITPNIDSFQAKLFGAQWRSAIFDHLFLFSKRTLCALLKEFFIIEKISTWGGLAAGYAPRPIKNIFDKAAKHFDFGDVMLVRAHKI